MVSIGSGFNNPYAAYGNQRTGRSQNAGSAGSARAPKIPNIPPKKTEYVKEHFEGPVSGSWGFCSGFTREQAIQYFNEGIANGLKNDVFNELIGTNVQKLNIDISNYDITNFNIIEDEDGGFTIKYTAQITCDYYYTKESDWEVGDKYTDEDGYVWELQEDGTWKDVTNDNNKGGDNGGDIVVGGIRQKEGMIEDKFDLLPDKEHTLSTEDFLNLRNVGIKFEKRSE